MAPQRCGIRGRDGEVEAGGRYGRIQQVRRALYAGGEPARRQLRVHVEIAGRPPAERDAGVPGTLLDIDPAPEPQQPDELRRVVGCEISVELEFERVHLERIADRFRDEMKPRRAGRPVDRKLGSCALASDDVRLLHCQNSPEIERRKTRDVGADGFPDRRAQLRGDGRKPLEPTRLQLQGDAAARRAEQRAHPPAEFQRGTAEVADREAIQHEPGRIIAQLQAGVLGGDAGEDRAIDIG